MADLKTTLRELSVATTIGLKLKKGKVDLNSLLNPKLFVENSKYVLHTKDVEYNFTQIEILQSFSNEYEEIIKNGYTLGLEICSKKHFKFTKTDKILWLGGDSQKETPEDISIGNYKISLKENSFILENMGLYKLLNCLTGTHHKQGLHFFKKYALNEYTTWFNTTWKLLYEYLQTNKSWTSGNLQATITLNHSDIVFKYRDKKRSLPIECSLDLYEKLTDGDIREKVFAKFINNNISKEKTYIDDKRKCATVACKNLVEELNKNLDYQEGLARFLRIHDTSYYYAKVHNGKCEIYKVPSRKELGDIIIITSIKYSVPKDQANIITTIKNIRTNKELFLRNECRFSHGQFNGTPETKLYYDHGSNLLSIYEQI